MTPDEIARLIAQISRMNVSAGDPSAGAAPPGNAQIVGERQRGRIGSLIPRGREGGAVSGIVKAAASAYVGGALAGAAGALREAHGGGWTLEPFGIENARMGAARLLADSDIEDAWAEGSAMSLEAAVALGRDLLAWRSSSSSMPARSLPSRWQ